MEDEFDIVYRQLFRKYYANLLFYATRMVGEEDAEDVVQEVFVELLHRKDSVTVGEIRVFLHLRILMRKMKKEMLWFILCRRCMTVLLFFPENVNPI